MVKECNEIIIRNFQLMKHIFDNLDRLTTDYKLSKNAIGVLQQLCLKHNSYHPYIQFTAREISVSRKCLYRTLNKLENENIINIVTRPLNGNTFYQVYFTVQFIRHMGEDDDNEFVNLYEQWLEVQREEKGENNVRRKNI